ncbi:MAG: PAS domain-containing protein [Chloroflexi bacterium]|nr:PAS domain-containing protein [Chloroflexota bacterium]
MDPPLHASALEYLVDGLALFDADQRVVLWNRRAAESLRVRANELLGESIQMLIARLAAQTAAPDDTRAQLDAAFASLDGAVELTIVRSEDATMIFTARFFPVRDATGNHLGAGLLLRDVTREREADAMKSQLLSTVSHELRTPLASIKGFATTLLRQDVKWDEATQRDFLRIIEEESDRLTEIIDNLLEMSQIEAGALRVKKEPTQLRALIRDVVDETRMRTESHYFITDLPAELPRAFADPRRVRQVLRNLLENAIKYTKGGAITITCEVEREHILISVADQGDGIPPVLLDKIFERFYQVDGASTRRVGGSGLGLAISRGIIAAHGGKIWAENTAPRGSVFRFTLPLAPIESNE